MDVEGETFKAMYGWRSRRVPIAENKKKTDFSLQIIAMTNIYIHVFIMFFFVYTRLVLSEKKLVRIAKP